MTDRKTLDQMTSDQLDQLYDERDRAEAALARIEALAEEYPVAIDTALIHEALDTTRPHTPDTIARIHDYLDSPDGPCCETVRRALRGIIDGPAQGAFDQTREAALARVRELAADVDDPTWRAPGTEVAARIRLALSDPADDGPTVADCAADDRAHWTQKYAGE